MFALVEITVWHYLAFIAGILFLLALDIGVFHNKAHVVKFKEALIWTSLWVCLALCFGVGLRFWRNQTESLQFVTGYLLELSLSMDNVFVIALIFAYFRVPLEYQHRVLFWGILGAIVMRGVMIGAGVALISAMQWVLYVLGAFVLYTGVKMLFVEPEVHPEKNKVVKWARKLYPVTPHLDGQKFVTTWNGRRALTPLALVLLMVETTDIIFAVDSIPAIFAVTTKPFIVFTSNMFAILGLRSLYFVLVGAIGFFRYLKTGLAVVLVFIGIKMLIDPHDDPPKWFQYDFPTGLSLLIVGTILLVSILCSIVAGYRERSRKRRGDPLVGS
jgi:tellurite resistance protein TerC